MGGSNGGPDLLGNAGVAPGVGAASGAGVATDATQVDPFESLGAGLGAVRISGGPGGVGGGPWGSGGSARGFEDENEEDPLEGNLI